MKLPVMPPVAPMLAKPAKAIPTGMQYEGKWDGFRAIIFRDGDEVVIGSRNEKPLTRYFPEIVAAVRDLLPPRVVLDGEIVIVQNDRLDFDSLLNRIHPADSRVELLAEVSPARFIAFDILALDKEDLMAKPQAQRRAVLETVLAGVDGPVHLAPATDDLALAQRWFEQFEGAGLDGVVAKPLDEPYQPNKRVLVKVKHERTVDCVVAGYRLHKTSPVVGSLLLGLYDNKGKLQHVGVSASFTMAKRTELLKVLEPLKMEANEIVDHPWGAWAEESAHENARLPGAQSRWSAGKTLNWEPIRPELVCEVGYDHMQGNRFRHTTQFKRWRPDRSPTSCTYEQLERPVMYNLEDVLSDN